MKLTRDFRFEASHIVPGHPGKCARLHGHSWKVTIEVQGDPNFKTGMVMDFADLKKAVSPVIERLDHRHLNFYIKIPTAENIATYIAHEVSVRLGMWVRVIVKETEPTEAVFEGPDDFHQAVDNEGWRAPFSELVAFQDSRTMARWYHQRKRELDLCQEKLHQIGSELASFEMYKASLDEHEAGKLIATLQYYQNDVLDELALRESSKSEKEKETT